MVKAGDAIGIAPSQSSLSRRMVIRSAHVPNRFAAGLQGVRLVTRHIDDDPNDGTTGVAGDCRPEECARHRCERSEAAREASAREGSRSRSDMYRVALRLLCITSRTG